MYLDKINVSDKEHENKWLLAKPIIVYYNSSEKI